MKNNYKAWGVNINDFYSLKDTRERLLFLLNFAALAPSSHNSQPWRFRVTDKEIFVEPDLSRALPSSDANHRELFISLGCAIENILVAADYYGLQPFFDEARMAISFPGVYAGDGGSRGGADHLIFSISRRCTDRHPYEDRIPDEVFLSWVRGLSGEGLVVNVVEKGEMKDGVADIVVRAIEAAMHDTEFRRELSLYLKSNFTKSSVGMPGFGFGMPDPVSLIAPFLMKRIDISKAQKKQDEKLLKECTPLFLIISAMGDGEREWVRVGRVYERIALKAEALGVKTHPMAAAIQIGDFYKELQRVLGLDFRPQFFCRVGYCAKDSRHSPRLQASEVMSS